MWPHLSTREGLFGLLCCVATGCVASAPDDRTGPSPSNRPSAARPAGDDCENTFPASTLPTSDDMHMGVRVLNEAALPELLSETPLYADIVAKEIHPAVRHYVPQFPLWSDTAEKERWIYIPECDTIDTSDMNDWSFPVGTRVFKEFIIDGRRIETRIIDRIGPGARDFAYASYHWNEDESEATKVSSDGMANASGIAHDIPSKALCLQCHGSYSVGGGRPSRALSFAALQLSHDGSGISLDALASDGAISAPPETVPSIPGSAEDQAALGYLHSNCGSCHNSTKDRVPQSSLDLSVDVGLATVEETGTWRTAINQPTQLFKDQHVLGRIVPGDPTSSAIIYRMNRRGDNGQMPPIGTNHIDVATVESLSSWIEGLE